MHLVPRKLHPRCRDQGRLRALSRIRVSRQCVRATDAVDGDRARGVTVRGDALPRLPHAARRWSSVASIRGVAGCSVRCVGRESHGDACVVVVVAYSADAGPYRPRIPNRRSLPTDRGCGDARGRGRCAPLSRTSSPGGRRSVGRRPGRPCRCRGCPRSHTGRGAPLPRDVPARRAPDVGSRGGRGGRGRGRHRGGAMAGAFSIDVADFKARRVTPSSCIPDGCTRPSSRSEAPLCVGRRAGGGGRRRWGGRSGQPTA